MRTRLLLATLLPLLLATAAACTNSPDPDVASAAGSAAPNASQSVSRLDQMIQYTGCMRDHGVAMADPEVDGETVRQGRIDQGFDKDKADAADEQCKQYRPAQLTGPDVDFKKELSRQFSRCMREHGVDDFPDPNPDGPIRISEQISADPQYDQARHTCDAQIAAASASRRPAP